MSAKSFQYNSKQTLCGVLPDIVANYQTLMCNPYSKTKPRTSKIPVALSRANNNKPVKMQCRGNTTSTQIPRPVHVPVTTAKQSCSLVMAAALPKGMFGGQAKSELKKFKIPKLNRDNSSTSANASKEGLVKTKPQYLGKHQSRVQPLSTVTISKSFTVNNANKIRTEKSSRIPTLHATKPKLNHPKLEVHLASTKLVLRTETKSSSTINNGAQCNNNNSKRCDSNVKPWPYGIPPCSRYEIKWGDPAYTGSYVDGEWWYDIVGAASKPVKWPDTLDTFPDIPTGMFELRSVECNDAPSAKCAACEGKPENILSGNICLENQTKSTPLQRYTTVQAVTQPTTIYNETRVASCNSTGVAKQPKTADGMESVVKPCSNEYRPFANRSCDPLFVTQPTILCDQARGASCSGVEKQIQTKRDSCIKSVIKVSRRKGHKQFASLSSDLPCVTQRSTEHNKCNNQTVKKLPNTARHNSQPLKSFPSFSPHLIYKRGIKRAADDNSNILLNKRCRMERQN